MILAGTGHRPDKLGGYSPEAKGKLQAFAEKQLFTFKPYTARIERVIVGMALGWDQALGWAAHSLKIPFDAYIPFEGQEAVWPAAAQREYRELLSYARKVVVCSPGGYAVNKMQLRNIHMVNDATDVLALWNGTPGGTANCLKYARHRKKPVRNVWDLWAA